MLTIVHTSAFHGLGLSLNPYWLAAALPVLLQFALFARWLHRRMRDDEIQSAFIRDIALNHLPYLYHALRLMAGHDGVALDEPPMVRYVDLNNGAPRRRW